MTACLRVLSVHCRPSCGYFYSTHFVLIKPICHVLVANLSWFAPNRVGRTPHAVLIEVPLAKCFELGKGREQSSHVGSVIWSDSSRKGYEKLVSEILVHQWQVRYFR